MPNRLEELLLAAKIDQDCFSHLSNTSLRTVRVWLAGRTEPPAPIIAGLHMVAHLNDDQLDRLKRSDLLPVMKAENFRSHLRQLALTQTEFSRCAGVSLRTVRRWGAGETPVPRWITVMLGIMYQIDRKNWEAQS